VEEKLLSLKILLVRNLLSQKISFFFNLLFDV
jgi:hypothetical protein